MPGAFGSMAGGMNTWPGPTRPRRTGKGGPPTSASMVRSPLPRPTCCRGGGGSGSSSSRRKGEGRWRRWRRQRWAKRRGKRAILLLLLRRKSLPGLSRGRSGTWTGWRGEATRSGGMSSTVILGRRAKVTARMSPSSSFVISVGGGHGGDCSLVERSGGPFLTAWGGGGE
ncbi:unnamed protein product [Ectocarpus sp. 12 AP-2014]